MLNIGVQPGLPLGRCAVGVGFPRQICPSGGGNFPVLAGITHGGGGDPLDQPFPVDDAVSGVGGGGHCRETRQPPPGGGVAQAAIFGAGVGDVGEIHFLAQQRGVGVILPVDYGDAVIGGISIGGDAADNGANFLLRVGGGYYGQGVVLGALAQRVGGGVIGKGGGIVAQTL